MVIGSCEYRFRAHERLAAVAAGREAANSCQARQVDFLRPGWYTGNKEFRRTLLPETWHEQTS